ncbi:histidinol-phosphate transaminase [Bermanella marisrubri]|uniref:Histidinol-phosphate aminotransferase n=1 Tax=Bermanella marisrubri TaxID=207949 RepID=Q1N5F8_9GAMM|nr:histidinol-phosphate transaminase [Bermanella marisrubri]EAT13119.1 putative aminotransferase [Oceanobacter sp. RED65] [Bermanella marisrubri]QIZ83897.1 histidinol-phosphate transaminase [Bermanella marisrubri]
MTLLDHAVQAVKELRPYQPGKPIDELAREFGLAVEDIVKLASNENPLGPSPKAITAIEKALKELTRYPDGNGFNLKKILSEKLEVAPAQITLGNGSSDILEFIVKCFVNDGDEVVVSQHAFAIYGLVAKMQGGVVTQVPAKNWGHDLEAMAAAISDKTKVVFVTNPNNPTGTWNTKAEVDAFLAKVPKHVVVLLDEAYFEYVHKPDYPNGIDYLKDYPNLVVTRTFSKAYGLASLRVGYGISSEELADLMNRVRPPFNVDSLALAAAEATLKDDAYVRQSIQLNDDGMAQLEQGFDQLNVKWIPSVGNFICFEVTGKAAEIYQGLLEKGVIVRPVAGYEMPDHLRVSIGTYEENETFLLALKSLLQG